MARGPLVIPSLAVLFGALLASVTPASRPYLPIGLVACGLALRGRAGLAVGFAGLGLLAVWTRAPPVAATPVDRVVAVEGVRIGSWRRDAYSWSCRARLTRIARGSAVRLVRSRVWLTLGGEERPPPERRFAARGLLGRAAGFHNGDPIAESGLRLWVKSRRLATFYGAADWRAGALDAGRERARHSQGVALARALALGEAQELDPRLRQSLRRMGLGHLLALSGLHVGILAGLALWMARAAFGRSPAAVAVFVLPTLGIGVFLALIGPRPAVVRAVVMAALGYAALARGGRPQAWNALAVALAILAVSEPEYLSELALWLTASATAGILWEMSSRRGRGSPLTALRVSCAAQLFTLPWALPAFHLLSPAAVVHNLWAVPWTALVLLASCFWLLLVVVRPSAALVIEPLLDVGVAPFRWTGALPAGAWASIPISLGRIEAGLITALGAALLRWAPLALPALAVVVGIVVSAPRGPNLAELALLDVGQGEAILIRDGSAAVLVDGGGWSAGDFGARVLVPALARLGVRRLDAAVLTHPDLDHCGGLVDLAAYLPIDEVWTAPGWPARGCALRLVTAPGTTWRPLWSGVQRSVGRWRLVTLHPPAGDRGGNNDRSLVLHASVHGFSALLTGDIEAAGERALVAGEPTGQLEADLLKVPHHGSRTSTTSPLLDAVDARLAWVSAGRANRFGHPHESVLSRLEASGARILRTDRDGLVRLRVEATGRVHLSFPGAPK